MIAVIDVSARRGYTLSVQQTPPTPTSTQQQSQRKGKGKGKTKATPTVSRQAIEQIREVLNQLPDKPKATQLSNPALEPEITRVDHYLNQLKATRPYFPDGLSYLVADGFYSKQKFEGWGGCPQLTSD